MGGVSLSLLLLMIPVACVEARSKGGRSSLVFSCETFSTCFLVDFLFFQCANRSSKGELGQIEMIGDLLDATSLSSLTTSSIKARRSGRIFFRFDHQVSQGICRR